MIKKQQVSPERVEKRWQQFVQHEHLTQEQVGHYKKYVELLWQWNENINLTAITQFEKIITGHLEDSLSLSHAIDLNQIQMIADVGTGGGFPGIPLKIKYPHLQLILIEVNQKKIAFLHEVVHQLKLTNVTVYNHDWRTFLRKTDYPVQLFVARASLQPLELMRMFKPASSYKNATLVYWASRHWQPGPAVEPFIHSEFPYTVGAKKRRLITITGTQKNEK